VLNNSATRKFKSRTEYKICSKTDSFESNIGVKRSYYTENINIILYTFLKNIEKILYYHFGRIFFKVQCLFKLIF